MKKLLKLVFGSIDRIIGIISVLLGVLSIVITIFDWKSPEGLSLLNVDSHIVILFFLVIIIVALVALWKRRGSVIKSLKTDIEKQEESFSNQLKTLQDKVANYEITIRDNEEYLLAELKTLQNIVSHYKEKLFQYFQQFIPNNLVKFNEKEVELFQDICRIIIDGVRESLKEYFKSQDTDVIEDIAITVKLIVLSEELIKMNILNEEQKRKVQTQEQWVITVYRDSYTYRHYRKERGLNGERMYSISGNTAFQHIVTNKQPHYLNNDLQKDAHYLNENPKWKDHYNSTLVVPISYENDHLNQYINVGFVAVDSRNKTGVELYNDKECKEVLSQAADLLCIFFLMLALFKYKPTQVDSDIQQQAIQVKEKS